MLWSISFISVLWILTVAGLDVKVGLDFESKVLQSTLVRLLKRVRDSFIVSKFYVHYICLNCARLLILSRLDFNYVIKVHQR